VSANGSGVALVSGATSGIGLAITTALARAGYRAFVCARDPQRLKETIVRLQDESLEVDGTPCDVRSGEQIHAFVRAAVERYGPVDVLVNNAGRSDGGFTA
jgi:ketoreductase